MRGTRPCCFVGAVFLLVAVRAAMAGRTPGYGPIQRLHTNPADVSGINAGTAVPTDSLGDFFAATHRASLGKDKFVTVWKAPPLVQEA